MSGVRDKLKALMQAQLSQVKDQDADLNATKKLLVDAE
jgi:hypothetical protein